MSQGQYIVTLPSVDLHEVLVTFESNLQYDAIRGIKTLAFCMLIITNWWKSECIIEGSGEVC